MRGIMAAAGPMRAKFEELFRHAIRDTVSIYKGGRRVAKRELEFLKKGPGLAKNVKILKYFVNEYLKKYQSRYPVRAKRLFRHILHDVRTFARVSDRGSTRKKNFKKFSTNLIPKSQRKIDKLNIANIQKMKSYVSPLTSPRKRCPVARNSDSGQLSSRCGPPYNNTYCSSHLKPYCSNHNSCTPKKNLLTHRKNQKFDWSKIPEICFEPPQKKCLLRLNTDPGEKKHRCGLKFHTYCAQPQ
jgi:hypothetical protein